MRRRRVTIGRAVAAVPLGLGLAFAAAIPGFHKCTLGQPFFQWLVPGACLAVAWAFIPSRGARFIAVIAAMVLACALSVQFSSLVHGSDYMSDPDLARGWPDRKMVGYKRLVAEELSGAARTDTTDYPAGWVSQSPFAGAIEPDMLFLLRTESFRSRTLWHGFLTGLYGKTTVDMDLYYPGGTLADGLRRLEWREGEP